MAHDGAAVAEFQKILDHRGVVQNEPIGALAHLQLGRAYAMQGDAAKAKAAYNDFLNLWKDADPDIPILKEAKAEYAKLNRCAPSFHRIATNFSCAIHQILSQCKVVLSRG
jgi:cytochrome c-type biogenesis protein CcmH/NrfG